MKGLKKPTGCIVIGTDDVWHKSFLDCFLSHDEIEIASSITGIEEDAAPACFPLAFENMAIFV